MSAYKSTVKGAIVFDGQTVRFELKRITMDAALSFKDATREQSAAIIKEHLLHLDAITDADGAELSVDTILSTFYFAKLTGAISKALTETGTVTQAQEDPSGGNSPTSSPGAGSQAA